MSYATLVIEKYRSRGVILDSNLLLLYLVGAVNPSIIGKGQYNKLSSFSTDQVIVLNQLLSVFKRVGTTAHVLTEVSNLVATMHDAGRLQVFQAFADTLEVFSEQEVSSYKVARRTDFLYLGLTDSILAELADDFLIVSNDARMVDMLRQAGIEALKWVEVLDI